MVKKKKAPKGLGGWLIIPIIGLFASAILYPINFFIFLIMGLTGYGALNWVISVLAAVISVYVIFLLVIMFKRSKKFPKWMIGLLWSAFLYGILTSIAIGDGVSVAMQLAGTILWTVYFIQSKRVENTFVK